ALFRNSGLDTLNRLGLTGACKGELRLTRNRVHAAQGSPSGRGSGSGFGRSLPGSHRPGLLQLRNFLNPLKLPLQLWSSFREELLPARKSAALEAGHGINRIHASLSLIDEGLTTKDRKSTRLNSSHVKISYA